jgi:acetyltransferase
MTAAHYLRPLLAPDSVAVVGASGRPGSLGRIVYENLLAGDFHGPLFAVNPKHATVLGRKAFASITAIARPVDLAVICAPAAAVPAILKDCRGQARAAVILSGAATANPAEYRRWRHELATRGREAGVRILGPASFGVIRTWLGLNATFGTVSALPGRLTLISQSGAVASALIEFARDRGIGFASVAVLGAGADVDFGEILEFALADPETDGIVLYVETVRDARAFLSALRAAARTKPVIVLKSGRVASQHTVPGYGTLEPDRVFDAALKRAGTVRVHSYTQLFAAAAILAAGRVPRGNRLAIVTNGRGPGLMAADRAAETGVALAALGSDTRAILATLLPRKRELGNPVDIESEATPEQFAAAIRALLADPSVDAVLALHVAVPAAPPTDTARAVAAAARDAGKPVLASWLGAVDRPEARAALEAGGIVNFYTPENAVEAFSFLAAYRRHQEWLLEAPSPQPELAAPDLAAAARVRARAIAAKRTVLTAGQTQALLAAFGIATAPFAVVATLQSAQRSARRIGYPVTLGFDAGQASPTRTNLRNGGMLARAFAELCLEQPLPRGAKRTVVVRRDFGSTALGAVKIGAYTDVVFGPVIAFGSVSAKPSELTLMLAPLSRRLAIDLVKDAAGADAPGEFEPHIDLLLHISALVCALPWVIEIELAPVQRTPGGVIVAAARAVIDARRATAPNRYRHMAIHPYPVELETVLTLKGGATLRVRPIRPEDAAMERAFVAGLSDQSRYLRFMQHLPALTPQMLARFTQVDYDRELALIALDGEAIVAVARYVANPDRESAEFAIAVADAWQGKGLAYALMRMLIRCAGRRGFKRLIGGVLAVNAPMLALATALGFVAEPDPDARDQFIVTLELAPPKS